MIKSWKVSARTAAITLIGWLAVTDLLLWLTHSTGWWPFKILLFICLSFLPGIALLRAMRMTRKTLSEGVVYSFGLSVLVLMLSGLAVNQLLPTLGVSRPLSLWNMVVVWNIVTASIIAIDIRRNLRTRATTLKLQRIKRFSGHVWILLAASAVLPCIAAFGAFRLNNGSDGLIAGIALGYAAALIVYAFLLRRRLPDGLLAWLIFIIGLSVLLMTSLRGWDIVGHDIEREFRVYTLTHMHAHWNIAFDRNPYNACLSITILPEMFARLLDISGLVVFKVILQIIFAVTPVIVYLLLRRYVSKLGALTGSLLFICYPTFINDSAMLTRQSVAYLFFALALLVMTEKVQKKRHKQLFLLCSLGAILSHYSTAYMFVGLFVVAVVFKLGATWWLKRRQRSPDHRLRPTVVSPMFAAAIFLMTFVWYSQITATSGGLAVTIQKSFANIPRFFSSDNKSSDTSTALLFAGGRTQVDLYQSYVIDPQLNSTTPADGSQQKNQYIPQLTGDDLPLTWLGERLHAVGIDSSFITSLRQNFSKVLQLLAIASVAYVAYRLLRGRQTALSPDFIYLSSAGIVLLTLLVALPVLSVNYGVLRAFQQAMIFLLLPMVILLVLLGRYIWARLRTSVAITSAVLLFFLFTGVFAQLLGGVGPSLTMNNQGLYYGLYYASNADTRAFAWLKKNVPKGKDVRAANFNKAFMHDPQYSFSKNGILPSQISDQSYVYVEPVQLQRKKVYTHYESGSLILTFPRDYYIETKDKLYSTTSTEIYK